MPDYKVYRITKKSNWCEITADNEEEAKEVAIYNDVWYGDDGSESNYDDEFEVEEV